MSAGFPRATLPLPASRTAELAAAAGTAGVVGSVRLGS